MTHKVNDQNTTRAYIIDDLSPTILITNLSFNTPPQTELVMKITTEVWMEVYNQKLKTRKQLSTPSGRQTNSRPC